MRRSLNRSTLSSNSSLEIFSLVTMANARVALLVRCSPRTYARQHSPTVFFSLLLSSRALTSREHTVPLHHCTQRIRRGLLLCLARSLLRTMARPRGRLRATSRECQLSSTSTTTWCARVVTTMQRGVATCHKTACRGQELLRRPTTSRRALINLATP
jgi:hypothetical protein